MRRTGTERIATISPQRRVECLQKSIWCGSSGICRGNRPMQTGCLGTPSDPVRSTDRGKTQRMLTYFCASVYFTGGTTTVAPFIMSGICASSSSMVNRLSSFSSLYSLFWISP